jgi:hypothetical protein
VASGPQPKNRWRAPGLMEALAVERAASESQLAGASAARRAGAGARARERDLAAVARLESLEELEAAGPAW